MNPSGFNPTAYRSQRGEAEKYQKFMKHSLREDYYMICIKKCLDNFDTNLNGPEKVCLAKCIDRAHDYFLMEEKNLSPFVEKKQNKDVFMLQRMLFP